MCRFETAENVRGCRVGVVSGNAVRYGLLDTGTYTKRSLLSFTSFFVSLHLRKKTFALYIMNSSKAVTAARTTTTASNNNENSSSRSTKLLCSSLTCCWLRQWLPPWHPRPSLQARRPVPPLLAARREAGEGAPMLRCRHGCQLVDYKSCKHVDFRKHNSARNTERTAMS